MNCINCYQEIPDGTNFCPYCGAKQSGYPEPVCTGAEEQPGEQTIGASSQTEGQNDQTPDSSASETAGGQQTQEETSDPGRPRRHQNRGEAGSIISSLMQPAAGERQIRQECRDRRDGLIRLLLYISSRISPECRRKQ